MSILNPADDVYAAAILDLRGSIQIVLRKGGKQLVPWVQMANADPYPATFMQAIYGGSLYLEKRSTGVHMHRWTITSRGALQLAKRLYFHCRIRQPELQVILDHYGEEPYDL